MSSDQTMPAERRRRREKHLERRRRRQFVEILQGGRDDAEEAREKRPPETAITRVFNITEGGFGFTDTVSVTSVAAPGVRYDDPDRGYGTEYASVY